TSLTALRTPHRRKDFSCEKLFAGINVESRSPSLSSKGLSIRQEVDDASQHMAERSTFRARRRVVHGSRRRDVHRSPRRRVYWTRWGPFDGDRWRNVNRTIWRAFDRPARRSFHWA